MRPSRGPLCPLCPSCHCLCLPSVCVLTSAGVSVTGSSVPSVSLLSLSVSALGPCTYLCRCVRRRLWRGPPRPSRLRRAAPAAAAAAAAAAGGGGCWSPAAAADRWWTAPVTVTPSSCRLRLRLSTGAGSLRYIQWPQPAHRDTPRPADPLQLQVLGSSSVHRSMMMTGDDDDDDDDWSLRARRHPQADVGQSSACHHGIADTAGIGGPIEERRLS